MPQAPGVGQTPPEGHIGTSWEEPPADEWAAKVDKSFAVFALEQEGQAGDGVSAWRTSFSKEAPQS
jgi:hypothetical protein